MKEQKIHIHTNTIEYLLHIISPFFPVQFMDTKQNRVDNRGKLSMSRYIWIRNTTYFKWILVSLELHWNKFPCTHTHIVRFRAKACLSRQNVSYSKCNFRQFLINCLKLLSSHTVTQRSLTREEKQVYIILLTNCAHQGCKVRVQRPCTSARYELRAFIVLWWYYTRVASRRTHCMYCLIFHYWNKSAWITCTYKYLRLILNT